PMRDPGAIRKGDAITARWLQGLRGMIQGAGKLAVQAPIAMVQGPSGRHIRLAGRGAAEQPIPARLTAVDSTSRAYRWIEVYRTAAHGWATLPGGPSSGAALTAYEPKLAIDIG